MLISTVQSCHQEARSHMVPTWFGVGTANSNQLAFVWKCPGRALPLFWTTEGLAFPYPEHAFRQKVSQTL